MTRARRRALTAAGAIVALLACGVAVSIANPDLPLRAARAVVRAWYRAETGTVRVAGADLGWSALGPRDGRPVLLVHGLGGESTALLPVARELARRGYRALLLDLPGCGRSPLAAEPLGIESAAEYVLGAAEALAPGKRPALLGHSLGGWIVAWAALAEPERCGPLVLTCAAGLAFEPPPLNVLMPRTVADGRRNVERMFAHPPFIPTPALWLAVRRERPSNASLMRSALSGRYLLDGLLPGLDVPALVIAAEKDGVVPPATARAMAAQIPDADFLEIEDASHMVIWEKPGDVARAVDAFLRAHR